MRSEQAVKEYNARQAAAEVQENGLEANYQSGTAHDTYAQECYMEGVRGEHEIEVCALRKQAGER